MICLFLLIPPSHVPVYGNCIRPPRSHRTSQVVYLQGPGGLEIPSTDIGGSFLDVDAVFRDEVDQGSYDLHVGCGGCSSHDPILTSPLPKRGYGPAELEPFTQTWYRSANMSKTFNVSLLGSCEFFTIRLVGNGNGSESIRWAAVVGLEEAFTAEELLSFPVFILRNHGPAWNDLGFTAWLWAFVGAPLLLAPCVWRFPPRSLRRVFYAVSSLASWLPRGGAHSPSVRPESSVICRLRPAPGTLPSGRIVQRRPFLTQWGLTHASMLGLLR